MQLELFQNYNQMTGTTAQELLKEFSKQCEIDQDPYFVVHFSREDDNFKGYQGGIDDIDASLIIKHLMKMFGAGIITLALSKIEE